VGVVNIIFRSNCVVRENVQTSMKRGKLHECHTFKGKDVKKEYKLRGKVVGFLAAFRPELARFNFSLNFEKS